MSLFFLFFSSEICAQVVLEGESGVFPVLVSSPLAWQTLPLPSGNHLASFYDPKTENRVEVLQKEVVRKKHASALVDAFSSQLVSSGFSVTSSVLEKDYTLVDGSTRVGAWTEYSFVASDIPIIVVTYSFLIQNHVILVVGYFSRVERESGLIRLEEVISGMVERR